jgi:hypothetical protein
MGSARGAIRGTWVEQNTCSYYRPRAMMLCGLPIRDELVLELAKMVEDEDLADRLETAYSRETKVLALTFADRDGILRALEDPPAGLEELRAVLLQEHTWRVREGLG